MSGTTRKLVVVVLAAVLAGAVFAFSSRAGSGGYVIHRLVANRPTDATNADRVLVNPWGLAASPTGPWWTANEARSSSTLYSGAGRKQLLTVSVAGGPTGVVYHGGTGFIVRGGGNADPARFIYACEDGTIRAWTPTVPGGWSTKSEVTVDDAGLATVFRGLTLLGNRLYAADFHNARVDVFDSSWRQVRRAGAFVDPQVPSWYAPFGIQALGGHVFVTYVFRAPVDGNDGPSGGYVDEFTPAGKLVARLPRSHLNEPWGLALAPRTFGRYGGDLLVGNFGSGQILAYRHDGGTWSYDGMLTGRNGRPLAISGLWAIAFGNGQMAGPRSTLFFSSGPHTWRGETEQSVGGLIGSIEPS